MLDRGSRVLSAICNMITAAEAGNFMLLGLLNPPFSFKPQKDFTAVKGVLFNRHKSHFRLTKRAILYVQ